MELQRGSVRQYLSSLQSILRHQCGLTLSFHEKQGSSNVTSVKHEFSDKGMSEE